ncbi:MAG: hypothetical protein V7670_03110 [Maribacter arcticus]|uniref:hypothetical protein n=1 Tax=Maribacter arcticus TaxID=561365 RepID=UPI003002E720
MDINKDFERMKDPIGYWQKNLSQYEVEELERIKKFYQNSIDEYAIDEREELYQSVNTHISKEAKLIELQNLDNHIRVDLDYNSAYQNVVLDTGTLIVEKRYLEFAHAYNLLDNESRGLRVLKNIVRRNLIKLLVKEIETPRATSTGANYKEIFENANSEIFFFKVLEDKRFKFNRTYVSSLYRFLKSKYGRSKHDVCIKCDELVFADFWNELNKGVIIKKYAKSAGLDSTDLKHTSYKLIESLFDESFNENN